MSKRKDIETASTLAADSEPFRSIEDFAWELGRIAGIREAAKMAPLSVDDPYAIELSARASKLKRRLK